MAKIYRGHNITGEEGAFQVDGEGEVYATLKEVMAAINTVENAR